MQNKRKDYRGCSLFGYGLGLILLLFLSVPLYVQAADAPKSYQAEDAAPKEGDKLFYETRAIFLGAGR